MMRQTDKKVEGSREPTAVVSRVDGCGGCRRWQRVGRAGGQRENSGQVPKRRLARSTCPSGGAGTKNVLHLWLTPRKML